MPIVTPNPVHHTRRAAIFVDFDNVYTGLQTLDAAAAERFAMDPGRWTALIAQSEGHSESRRFLVRNCYLNPSTFSKYRAYWTRAGYRVVDCPSLTQQGKSSTDINLVLDAVDILAGPGNIEEFFIASADADFTSLVQRFRAADRLTTVIVAGAAASAYRNMADDVVGADDFVSILNGPVAAPPEAVVDEDEDTPTAPVPTPVSNGNGTTAIKEYYPSHAVTAALKLIKAAPGPIRPTQVAEHLRTVNRTITEDWEGHGTFRSWLEHLETDIGCYFKTPPGWVWDKTRFTIDDLPNLVDTRPAIEQQVTRVTDVPSLSSEQFKQLFIALEPRLKEDIPNRNELSKRVRDDCADAGTSVGRSAINYVIQGLLYAEVPLNAGYTAQQLAMGWARNVEALCSGARMEFSDPEKVELRAWVSGGLAT